MASADDKPWLLDLFAGAGGAGEGYRQAGFHVVAVDIAPQTHNPHEFYQDDALAVLDTLLAGREWHGYRLWDFDAIHASPPCQGYSMMSACRTGLAQRYARLIDRVRERLYETGTAWILENVIGAPMPGAIVLCGHALGLPMYRHRQFESSHFLFAPPHLPHRIKASRAGHWVPGTYISTSGHCSPVRVARDAMGIHWMTSDELSQAIPPAYTRWIGQQLLPVVTQVRRATT